MTFGCSFARHLQPIRAIARAEDRVLLWVKVLLQEIDRIRVVIDHQDALFDETQLRGHGRLLRGNRLRVGARGGKFDS